MGPAIKVIEVRVLKKIYNADGVTQETEVLMGVFSVGEEIEDFGTFPFFLFAYGSRWVIGGRVAIRGR